MSFLLDEKIFFRNFNLNVQLQIFSDYSRVVVDSDLLDIITVEVIAMVVVMKQVFAYLEFEAMAHNLFTSFLLSIRHCYLY